MNKLSPISKNTNLVQCGWCRNWFEESELDNNGACWDCGEALGEGK